MPNLEYQPFTRRRRPHFHPPDSTLFVTFRLVGSIPQSLVRAHKAKRQWLTSQLHQAQQLHDQDPESSTIKSWIERIETYQREWFLKSEEILHRATHGPTWLKDERLAIRIVENLHRLDGEAYRLDAF